MAKKEQNEKMSVPVYYLSNFKKYTRKIYGFGEFKLPRPIRVNVFIVFLSALFVALIVRFLPPFSYVFSLIPDYILFIVIPALIAYLLSEFKEENRTFFQYMRSSIKYTLRKRQNKAYYKGEEVDENVREEKIR